MNLQTQDQLAEIYQFRRIDDQIGTAGQPTTTQFSAIRAAGYQAVINLALPTSDNALPNEGALVTGLGMAYLHFPVNFQSPQAHDFHLFCGAMDALKGQRVLVHCAANKRVSAFVFLYRVLRQNLNEADAKRDLDAIWQPDEVWKQFIQGQLKQHGH